MSAEEPQGEPLTINGRNAMVRASDGLLYTLTPEAFQQLCTASPEEAEVLRTRWEDEAAAGGGDVAQPVTFELTLLFEEVDDGA